jgi:dTDP-4-dehydrorhamnose 3,5-epimerase
LTLTEENQYQLWVPPGFAHGFLVLSELADFQYKTTDYWYPEHERSILWSDASIAIDWPKRDQQGELIGEPQLASKDASAKLLEHAEVFA